MAARVIDITALLKKKKSGEQTSASSPGNDKVDTQLQDKFRLNKVINKNPLIWKLIEEWIVDLSMDEIEIFYGSILPYYEKIKVPDDMVRIFYQKLEDEREIEDLVDAERLYWASLSAKQEKPWLDLFNNYWDTRSKKRRENRNVYDPLLTPAYEFSEKLVKKILLLRFLFRQQYPR